MSYGSRILRLSNAEVMRDCEMACIAIGRFCDSESLTLRPHASPLPGVPGRGDMS